MIQSASTAAEGTEGAEVKVDPLTGLRVVPPWLSQPYFRPPPPPPPPNKRAKKDIQEYIESRRPVVEGGKPLSRTLAWDFHASFVLTLHWILGIIYISSGYFCLPIRDLAWAPGWSQPKL